MRFPNRRAPTPGGGGALPEPGARGSGPVFELRSCREVASLEGSTAGAAWSRQVCIVGPELALSLDSALRQTLVCAGRPLHLVLPDGPQRPLGRPVHVGAVGISGDAEAELCQQERRSRLPEDRGVNQDRRLRQQGTLKPRKQLMTG